MGYIENPKFMILLMKAVLEETSYKIIIFSSVYPPLDGPIKYFSKQFLGTKTTNDASSNYYEINPNLIKYVVQLF